MANILDSFKDEQDYKQQFDKMYHIWSNNGVDYDPAEKRPLPRRVKMADTLALPNATFLIPQVINQFLRESIEPMLIGPSLLSRIDYKPGMTISFPIGISAMSAYDIAPGQEFPEYGPDLAGAESQEIKISKSGLALKFLDDIVEQDNFGLVRLWVKLAHNALSRHKEVKIFNYILNSGVTLFNNASSPATSKTGILGRTTGRDMTGAFNGTLTHDDFFEAVAFGMSQGYVYNTILMHPLTWAMWVKDPYLRAFAMQTQSYNYFAAWTGDPTNRSNNYDPLQKMGSNPQGFNADPSNLLGTMSPTMATAPQMPAYFPFPMRIIVSPFVPLTESSATTKITDIIMFDSSNLGALVVKEDIQTAEWREPSRDITKMKIWESYALAMFNQGQGIGVLRNIKVGSNELALPAELHTDVSSLPTGWAGY